MQKVKIITHLSCLIRYIAGGPEKDPVAGILASSASARKRAQTRRFFTEKSSEKEYDLTKIQQKSGKFCKKKLKNGKFHEILRIDYGAKECIV